MEYNTFNCMKTLLDIIQTNYKAVKSPDFQSCFNLQEALITLLVNALPKEEVQSVLEKSQGQIEDQN